MTVSGACKAMINRTRVVSQFNASIYEKEEMMKKLLALCLLVFVMGCELPERRPSEIMQESAEIIQLSYVPSQIYSGTGVGPTMSFNGKMGMGMTVVSGTTREEWAVVLRCSLHGKTFAIDSQELYNKVKTGDKVTLWFYEEREYPNPKTIPTAYSVVDYHTQEVWFNDGTKVILNR